MSELQAFRPVHADNYGVRTMWHTLQREGIDIGRKQTYPPDAHRRPVRHR